MQLQVRLGSIPCAIALDSETKAIAFNRPPEMKEFIDIRGDITAIWGKGAMNVNQTEYKYEVWHSVATDDVLKEYFKSLIEADHFQRQQNIFGGF